jgi:hypothetical protein
LLHLRRGQTLLRAGDARQQGRLGLTPSPATAKRSAWLDGRLDEVK